MKSPTSTPQGQPVRKEGFILFFTMGMLAVLSLFGLLTYTGANLESKAAVAQVSSAEALYQADSGASMVKLIVEHRFDQGMSLEEALDGLSVSPTGGQQFQTITNFNIVVPGLVFEFKSTGWSGTAYRTLRIRYLRPSAMRAGLYGNFESDVQSNTQVYGYNSDQVAKPTSSDSNGKATVGSNVKIDATGGSATIHGNIVLGQYQGTDAEVVDKSAVTGETTYMGPVEPDPLGAAPGSGGYVDDLFAQAMATNNNIVIEPFVTAAEFAANEFDYGKGNDDGQVIFSSGDYYFTDFSISSKAEFAINATSGPVRIFMDGPFNLQPGSEILPTYPEQLQIYVRGGHDVFIKPNSDMAAMIYAPFSEIDFQPNGDFYGVVWGEDLKFAPGGDVYVDTTLQNRLLLNKLETLAWNEVTDVYGTN